jgi:hypothetical protein
MPWRCVLAPFALRTKTQHPCCEAPAVCVRVAGAYRCAEQRGRDSWYEGKAERSHSTERIVAVGAVHSAAPRAGVVHRSRRGGRADGTSRRLWRYDPETGWLSHSWLGSRRAAAGGPQPARACRPRRSRTVHSQPDRSGRLGSERCDAASATACREDRARRRRRGGPASSAERRYPAHLDTVLDPAPGEWWGDRYGLARPPETSVLEPSRAARRPGWTPAMAELTCRACI